MEMRLTPKQIAVIKQAAQYFFGQMMNLHTFFY